MIRLRGKYGSAERVALRTAEVLFEEFPEVVGVELRDHGDGSNLRVVVSRDDPELIDRLMGRIFEILDECGEIGNIIPEIARIE